MAHHFSISLLKLWLKIPGAAYITKYICRYDDSSVAVDIMGIHFPNPVGLAAGFDKNASMMFEMDCLGFGFIEIGTITPQAQPGNPQPRMFRLPAYKGLINRMGFNNEGAEAVVLRLKKKKKGIIVGGNIGKNKSTPNELAGDDYSKTFLALFPYVDYFVVNVSSPNTPGLRELQEKESLSKLASLLSGLNKQQTVQKPLLIKIAPDLNEAEVLDVIDIVKTYGFSGIIATNTTIDKSQIPDHVKHAREQGGLSGAPLTKKSTEMIRFIRRHATNDMVIIGVGGIFNSADVIEKLEAGANLIQVYTGFIYEGPFMVRRMVKQLAHRN